MGQNPPPASRPARPPSPSQPSPAPSMRSWRFWVILAVLFAANILITNIVMAAVQTPTVTISYNAFLDQLNSGNVVSITSTGDSIIGNARAR